ncbi:MAG: hypothetical protein KAS32_16590 [Candidatus Peribacteraceae bacterium]|nr:hypothetical protein [Candidatus Peribacteraceae bacterium]
MSTPQDVFGSSPKTVLNKPMMHIQDQKTTGTHGGDSITGDNDRDFNTILINEISGASLSGNKVTLAAGTYLVECVNSFACLSGQGGSKEARSYIENDVGNKLLIGSLGGMYASTQYHSNTTEVSGVITLTTSTTIKSTQYQSLGSTTAGNGQAANQAPYEVYGDLKIWQLDATRLTPAINNRGLYPLPGDAMVTGNIIGFDYYRVDGHVINVFEGVCMDALNNSMLSGEFQAVTIPSDINQLYYLFICDDGIVRTDMDINGANLLFGSVNDLRWLGLVRTDASGEIIEFYMKDDSLMFRNPSTDMIVSTGIGTSVTLIPMTDLLPATRCYDLVPMAFGTATDSWMAFIVGPIHATNTQAMVYFGSAGWYVAGIEMTDITQIYARTGSGTASICINSVKMRR